MRACNRSVEQAKNLKDLIEMNNHNNDSHLQLMTAQAFMQSYDLDVLYLQDDPCLYIKEIETELEGEYPMAHAFDAAGNKVWPVGILRQYLQITGDYTWDSAQAPTLTAT